MPKEIEQCCVCGYIIKDMDNPFKSRRDCQSAQYSGKWVCGNCRDEIRSE